MSTLADSAPRNWRRIRALVMVTSVAAIMLLVRADADDFFVGPLLVVSWFALGACVASVVGMPDSRSSQLRALLAVLAGCSAFTVVLWRETGDWGLAYLLGGIPAVMAIFVVAYNVCDARGWIVHTQRRKTLLWVFPAAFSLANLLGLPKAWQPELLGGGLVFLVAILFWPARRQWPPPPRYAYRSSVLLRYALRGPDDEMFESMAVPDVSSTRLWVSDLIVGVGPGLLKPTIDREFAPTDVVRVYAVVGAATHAVRGRVDVIESSERVVHTTSINIEMRTIEPLPPPVDPLTGAVPVFAPRKTTDAPILPTWAGEIDVTLPLADLAPGDYWVRVTATDDVRSAVRDVAIAIEQACRA
jgi:hypothetical protein